MFPWYLIQGKNPPTFGSPHDVASMMALIQKSVEIKRLVKDLNVGMVLSRHLKAKRKAISLGKETDITKVLVDKVKRYTANNDISPGLFVYQKKLKVIRRLHR